MGKNWLGVCGTLENKWFRVHNGTKGVIPSHKLKPAELNCAVTSFVSPLLTVHYRAEHETEQELEDKEDPKRDQGGDQEEEQVEDQEESKEENDGEDEEDGDNEESDEEDDVDHEEDVEDDGPEPWELIFLRAINSTNKLGGATNENLTIDGFKLQTGSIYVQSPVSVQFERYRVLLDQNGPVGPARRSHLQSLGIGWGMPKQAFVVHESNMHEINEEDHGRALEMQFLMSGTHSGISSKEGLLIRRGTKQDGFFDGKIIRLVEWSRNSDECEILDYESNSGRVNLKHLETYGVSSVVKEQKFPLRVFISSKIYQPQSSALVQEEGQEILRVSTESSDSTSEADNIEERKAIFVSEGSFNSEDQSEESGEGAVSAQRPKANAKKHHQDDDAENGPSKKKLKAEEY